jgi:hypothetical protein
MWEGLYTPRECHLLPAVAIIGGVCENECCDDVHAVYLICQWGFWGFTLLLWERGES